ncbi:YsnF/AvaK domain-containing protein [Arsenicicoccus sp. oral taxon 190]|uniref:YsnF/AvaK domain-containing protein n=1 Tax=Arsenicicoccus sp. oral taxon 190 TaxID=1658671 RepID=UPI00067DB182|nr:DUF2382 domain-containing protein [Arsenicicoccus sp. oral taxon 190]
MRDHTTAQDDREPGTAHLGRRGEEGGTVTRHEEQLWVETRPVISGGVRLSKRVVTEERTVTVRREELVVEELGPDELAAGGTDQGNPAKDAALDASLPHRPRGGSDNGAGGSDSDRDSDNGIEIILHEERIVTQVVPIERVRVHVDRVTRHEVVEADLAKEVVTVEQTGPDDVDSEDVGHA